MKDLEIKKVLENWPVLVQKYQTPSNKKAIIQLVNTFLPFVAIWVLMYFSLSWSYWITLFLALVNGFFLARIFIIQHDCGHQSFLKSRKWNNRVGFICSFFSSIPYKYWARVHSYHHAHTGQLEHRDIGDINFLTVKEYDALSKWGKLRYRIFRNPIFLFTAVPVLYLSLSQRFPFISKNGWTKVRWSQLYNNLWLVVVYGSLALFLGWKQFLLVHVPVVVFFMIIAFWFFYVQHQHDDTYMKWQKNWKFLLAAIQGATYYKLPRPFMWLTGDIGFHHIHHLSSKIPNYNLRKCARENPIFQKYVTELDFKGSLKLALNKLWDEKSEKMITFKEYYQLKKEQLTKSIKK